MILVMSSKFGFKKNGASEENDNRLDFLFRILPRRILEIFLRRMASAA